MYLSGFEDDAHLRNGPIELGLRDVSHIVKVEELKRLEEQGVCRHL